MNERATISPLVENLPLQEVAEAVARKAGAILMRHFGNLTEIRKKGAIDLVTEADLASEACVVACIRKAFPDHAILAEESGRHDADSPFCWVIDPLDGTTNFAHGLPVFGVSIGLLVEGIPTVGVVFNPAMDALYSAEIGKIATKTGVPISVTKTSEIEDSLLVTGFPYDLRDHFERLTKRFDAALFRARAVRRLGAAAIDLCLVAEGVFDGFFEEHLKPWDTAAGMVILQAAGGTVTRYDGTPHAPGDATILATNGRIHDSLKTILEI